LSLFSCSLRVLGCDIGVRCGDGESFELLRECYSAFLQPIESDSPSILSYDISQASNASGWLLRCGESVTYCEDRPDLLYFFEKDMTQRVQMLRTDLFFVHAAAMSIDDRCILISGASGSGKSSLAWSMCNNGFDYLSDELAPIDPTQMRVEPYPHALCLKGEPLSKPSLPKSTVYTSRTIHVPACEFQSRPLDRPCALGILVFIDETRNGHDLAVRSISGAESGARLYSNGLNQLAHSGYGLPAVARIAGKVPSYIMAGGTVEERAEEVRNLLLLTHAEAI
jgi:hypothetical protein